MKRAWTWINDHPFLSALIVMLIIVIPGFTRIEQAASRSREAATEAKSASESVQTQANRNTKIVDCLATYAAELTDSLQDRDVVVQTARAAQREVWDTFRKLIDEKDAPPNSRQILFRAIARYEMILDRLERTEAVNPYPDITNCLPTDAVEAVFRLMSYHPLRVRCSDHPTTIRGSSQSDILRGTSDDDVIHGFKGNDIIIGGAGNDVICGGQGTDTINGGQGHDHGRGQDGLDFCIQVENQRSC